MELKIRRIPTALASLPTARPYGITIHGSTAATTATLALTAVLTQAATPGEVICILVIASIGFGGGSSNGPAMLR